MKKICSSDIESNNWIEFLMIGIYDGKKYSVFDDLEKYINFVLKNYKGHRIYFHNGGKFDFLFFLDVLMKKGKITFLNSTSGLISLKLTTKKGTYEFVDSIFLLPASLETLISNFDIKEKKVPIDFTKQRKYTDKKLHKHLKNDCISLYNILRIVEKQTGFLNYTVASTALKIFSRDYFDGDFWSVSNYFDSYFRKNYYRGGRVEVYKGYGENLFYYDVNSLYPYVMLENMPSGSPIRTNKFLPDKIGFYKIRLLEDYTEKISILIKKTKGGNFYVNAKKGDEFFLISPELKILAEKYKFKVIDGYYFKNSYSIFTDYVNDFYEKKKKSKTPYERYISKLMLNSLYGKFGQKLLGQDLEFFNNQDQFIIYNAEMDLVLVEKERRIKYKGVYLAAYITSLARAHHYRLMQKIGFDNIFYCDTDSIITSKKIKTGDNIGELKLEAEIKKGVFVLPKVYAYKDKKGKEFIIVKGFKKTFSFNDLLKLAQGKIKVLEQMRERVLGFKESLRRKNNIKNSKGTFLKTAMQNKQLINNYTRRKKVKSAKFIFNSMPFDNKDIT